MRVGTHNSSFHCDEALGCFLIHLTFQFAGTDVVRTRDSQVPSSLPYRFSLNNFGLLRTGEVNVVCVWTLAAGL